MKIVLSGRWLLAIWIVLGGFLRFLNLGSKPIWTDEVATMVFSLGNDYQTIPLNQVISLEQLLGPLQINPQATVADVVSHLIHQDNHPPLYFVLAHLWLQLFPSSDSYLSVWVARSLPALFGTISIPLTYFLAKSCFRCPRVGQMAAGLMALSPYGIFLAQEARHYTLGTIFVILSLSCLVSIVSRLYHQQIIPWGLVYGWLLINCFGLGTHYFFSLTLMAEVFVLLALFIYQVKEAKICIRSWLRVAWVGLGTLTAALVWTLQVVPQDFGNGMTAWMSIDYANFRTLISPIFQLLAAWITMISLLPIESSYLGIILLSGSIMIGFFIKLIPHLKVSLARSWQVYHHRLSLITLVGFMVGAIALFLIIAYGLGMDITRGARYSFVYFPSLIVLIALGLGDLWKYQDQKKIVIMVFLMAFLSGLTVVFNLGYQKYYGTNKLLEVTQAHSNHPLLIATTHETLVQTGEMIGIAWQIKQKNSLLKPKPQFILVHQQKINSPESPQILKDSLGKMPKPVDVWAVNFQAELDLKECHLSSEKFPYISGYTYQHYLCGDNVAKQTVSSQGAILN